MKKSLLTLFALLCVVMQGSWAQEPTPSTALEPYITSLGNRMVYKFNYPSTSVTGEPVVLSSLLACWAPTTPPAIKTMTDVGGPMADEWYTIDGRRVGGKPTQPGLYIVRSAEGRLQGKNGKLVVIK